MRTIQLDRTYSCLPFSLIRWPLYNFVFLIKLVMFKSLSRELNGLFWILVKCFYWLSYVCKPYSTLCNDSFSIHLLPILSIGRVAFKDQKQVFEIGIRKNVNFWQKMSDFKNAKFEKYLIWNIQYQNSKLSEFSKNARFSKCQVSNISEKLNCKLMLFRYTWQKIERHFYQVDSHRIVEIRLRWNNLTPDGVRRMKNLLYVLWKILISEFRKSRVANSSKRLRSNASHKDKICITYAAYAYIFDIFGRKRTCSYHCKLSKSNPNSIRSTVKSMFSVLILFPFEFSIFRHQ